ncbi:syndetin isoform X2 [Momordica charantia]|uniref:Syndetin isoform X2 n=1 Tax=Momordica charantia TaxID=3673 RepID=A0A6J1DJ46_MOMCH|nr:syndetin isoform X2 [Momordica charantia]
MQPNLFPFGSVLGNPLAFDGDLSEGFPTSRFLFFVPFFLLQGGGMDLSRVGEKILSSVRSARSLGLLPATSDRPEVPARAVAAAAVARALAGLPPHQRFSLSSSSEELSSIYGSRNHGQEVEELEEVFYEEDFDPVRHVLEHVPSEENDLEYLEKQATKRLAQLDKVAERLSRHVMEHHEVMVKGMHLVRELEKDLKIANVICRNGKRHLTSSMLEVSRDLIVNSNSKKKQALLDMLPVLSELRHVVDMQSMLESLVEEGNYYKAFQVLSEYLQLLDSISELSVIQDMSRGVEVWLGRALQKLDSLLIEVCQEFKKEGYLTVVDAYALIGDVSGLAEKIQSFFMQEVISETHSALRDIVQEDQDVHIQNSRLTYSDLCTWIPESKFRQCSLKTLAVLFTLMCSYYQILSFQLDTKDSDQTPNMKQQDDSYVLNLGDTEELTTNVSSMGTTGIMNSVYMDDDDPDRESRMDSSTASTSGSPWYHLRKDAISFVSQTLQRGRKNLWQLTTSRVSVLLSSAAVCSTSIHQFLKNYEDLNVFILAGEAFCGVEAVEFRQKLKSVCENYYVAFHKQSMHALKMVMEKENWLTLPPDTVQVVSFAGLIGDGAPLFVSSDGSSSNAKVSRKDKSSSLVNTGMDRSGFLQWLKGGNPFLLKLMHTYKEGTPNGASYGELDGSVGESFCRNSVSPTKGTDNLANGANTVSEDEDEDLLADFIDEDSQLPSRLSKPKLPRNHSSNHINDEFTAQTGSSLCLLRSMDKYARLMQKLEIVNVEFFKGICQLFGVFFYFVYETFGQLNTTSGGKGFPDSLNYKLKTALSRAAQDCDQWIRPHSSSPSASNTTFSFSEVTPSPPGTSLGYLHGTSFGLKERSAGADSLLLVARIMQRSKAHIQSMLLQTNAAVIEDFYVHLAFSLH